MATQNVRLLLGSLNTVAHMYTALNLLGVHFIVASVV